MTATNLNVMNKCSLLKYVLLYALLVLGHSPTINASNCHHSRGRTDNELIPDARLVLTPAALTENVAVSVLGEVGRRNYRINGTLGFLFGASHYLKFSTEYLTQKLGYRFSSGKTEHWMHQTAVGGEYQKDIKSPWLNNVLAQGFYSFAPNHDLRRKRCVEVCELTRICRHIAGSHAGGGALGATFIPWKSARFQLRGNYDYVLYDRKCRHKLHVSGFGGSFAYLQELGCNFDFSTIAELRTPFYYFEGLINWHAPRTWQGFTIGLFGSHTQGRHHLPNNNVAGIQLSYLFGFRGLSKNANQRSPSQNTNKKSFWKRGPSKNANQKSPSENTSPSCLHLGTVFNSSLASWVSTPAVYLPEVLAIADQKRKKSTIASCPGSGLGCISTPPTSTTIPTQNTTNNSTVNVSSYFTDPTHDNPLTYSLVSPPTGFTINPQTGVITIGDVPQPMTFTITMVAQNICGSTSQTFIIQTH
jgi:hypothetical protein